jgi:SAM-dependent methyltransferase
MWRIESELDGVGATYDHRAAVYDHLVRSRMYNRLAWSCTPGDYAEFAAAAFASASGPLLEAAAGSAAATARLHATSRRPTVLVDESRAMLERAARRIAAAGGDGEADRLHGHIRLVQADLLALPFSPCGFTTVLGLGLIHLFEDLAGLVAALCAQLAPAGRLYLAGLVTETRRGRRYLEVLHRAGEVAQPRSARELHVALGRPADFYTIGCMAFATLTAD